MEGLKEYLTSVLLMEAKTDNKLKNEIKAYVKTIEKYAGRISVKDTEIILPENSHLIIFTEPVPEGATFAPITNNTIKFSKNVDQNSLDKIAQYIDWSNVEKIEIDWNAKNINNLDCLNKYSKEISKHKQLNISINNKLDTFKSNYYIYHLDINYPKYIELDEVHEFKCTRASIQPTIIIKHADILYMSCACDISKVKSVDKLTVEFTKSEMPKEDLEGYKFPQKVNNELIITGSLLAKYYMGDGHHRMMSVDEMPKKFVDSLKKTKCPNIYTPDEWGGKRGVFDTKKVEL